MIVCYEPLWLRGKLCSARCVNTRWSILASRWTHRHHYTQLPSWMHYPTGHRAALPGVCVCVSVCFPQVRHSLIKTPLDSLVSSVDKPEISLAFAWTSLRVTCNICFWHPQETCFWWYDGGEKWALRNQVWDGGTIVCSRVAALPPLTFVQLRHTVGFTEWSNRRNLPQFVYSEEGGAIR